MKIRTFQLNMFGVNTYVVWDETTREAAIVDPGMITDADNAQIDSFIRAEDLKLKYLINTHLHIDHVFGNSYIELTYGLVTSANTEDKFLSDAVKVQARMFNLPDSLVESLSITNNLNDGDKLYLGNEEIDILAVPGHSPGSIALYMPSIDSVITGDALFQNSIGRTDLPRGNHATLIKSITEKLLTLPGKTIVYPGHGPKTTIEYESKYNPFI